MAIIQAPSYNERLLIVGANGSGKTKLAELFLASGYPRTVTIDLKGEINPPFPDGEPVWRVRKPIGWQWRQSIRKGHLIYQPPPEYRTMETMDAVFHHLYARARKYGKKYPFILYLDEGLSLAHMGGSKWLSALVVEGRSLKCGVWISSQRPLWIPVEIRTEAWRWYIFYLAYRDDIDEIIKYSGGRLSREDLTEALADYSFWEMRRHLGGKLSVRHYPPIDLIHPWHDDKMPHN